jgi:hypothetical protein
MFGSFDQVSELDARFWPDDAAQFSLQGWGRMGCASVWNRAIAEHVYAHRGATMVLARIRSLRLFATICLLICPATFGQQSQPAAPPTPTKILAAKKIFVSNAGVDAASPVVFERTTGPNEPYSQFYFAMQRWGRYELVGTPSDADLVFQLRLTAPLSSCQTYEPQIALTIFDSNTHFVLWTVTKRVKDARLRDNWEKNLTESIGDVLGDLKQLTTQTAVAKN